MLHLVPNLLLSALTSYLFCAHRYHNLNQVKKAVPDLAHIEKIKRRFMSLRDVFDLKDFISGWFFGTPWEELRRTNIENFVAYGFDGSEMAELRQQVCSSSLEGACVLYSSGHAVVPSVIRAHHASSHHSHGIAPAGGHSHLDRGGTEAVACS